MNLEDLNKKLNRDKTFREACDRIGDRFHLAMHCAIVCEERGVTDKELASAAGCSVGMLTEFHEVDDDRLAGVVKYLEPWLRRRGVDTDYWMSLKKPAQKAAKPPQNPGSRIDPTRGLGGRDTVIPTDRLSQGKKQEKA